MIYLISDTHFNHRNIIRYCGRPFPDVDSMNKALVRNWNSVVKPRDLVLMVGDLGSRPHYWLSQLNGDITMIRGSHDSFGVSKIYTGEFLALHDPADRPKDWHGWIIHGHKHNNDLNHYPFVSTDNMTVNVSVELIGYTPISMDKIKSLTRLGSRVIL